MRIVTAQELESWLTSGKVLEKDARGPKVVALDNGLFLKIFHTRKHPLIARLWPACKRFADNARLLARLQIPTPSISEVFWLDKRTGLSGCLYHPLPGTSLEALFHQSPDKLQALLPKLATFVRQLHRKKIYFRSLHIGNILLLPDNSFGLVDFLDLKQHALPLTSWHIKRNLRHLQRHLCRNDLKGFPVDELIRLYYKEVGARDTQGTASKPF